MLVRRPKSANGLERSIARYEAKLAKAASPTQRHYAASMLHMARDALTKALDGAPVVEKPGADIVDLGTGDYHAH